MALDNGDNGSCGQHVQCKGLLNVNIAADWKDDFTFTFSSMRTCLRYKTIDVYWRKQFTRLTRFKHRRGNFEIEDQLFGKQSSTEDDLT